MVCVTEWEDLVKKKIRYMTNQVWDGLGNTDVESFMSNFKKEDEIVGWVLLDLLVYYSSEQEVSIISNLMRLLKRDIWISKKMAQSNMSSKDINIEFDKIYKRMCFVPVDESDPSASSFSLTSQLKKSGDVSRFVKYIDIDDIPLMMAMNYKYFVFYDDLIGTGTQFDTFWRKNRFGKQQKISIQELAQENQDIIFYYLAMGGCQDGVCKLKKNFPNVRVIVSQLFSKDMDVFSDANEYWELNPDKKKQVLDFIVRKENELSSKSEFTENLPILFQHGRASNTALSLYWFNKSEKWKALYKR